jgi:transcriptional regulator PpsR
MNDDAFRQTVMGHFGAPERFFGNLDADMAGSLIAAASDVALVMDEAGVIRDVAFGSEELSSHGYQDWIGKSWSEIVTVESRAKVEASLQEAHSGRKSKWRHINHPSQSGADFPVSYSVFNLSKSETNGNKALTVAFGRDLRPSVALQQRVVSAQLAMERDYWRLRHIETRYRLLFQLASEGVLIFDANTEKLEEANPAAYQILGDVARKSGWTLGESLDAQGAKDYAELVAKVKTNGRADTFLARTAEGARDMSISVSLFRQDNSSHLMVRLAHPGAPLKNKDNGGQQRLLKIMEAAPDALVVTDLDGRILSANRAFLELIQIASEDLVLNQSLEKWLGRAGVDMNVLISNLRQGGTVRLFATTMRGEFGSNEQVEISAVSVTSGDLPCLGFTIRDVGRRLSSESKTPRDLPRSAGQMTELVGRVPLRDIVRETTDMIEQLCIEAALELTHDNRASAAEMLGLSRQSLYVKLRRFGIGDSEVEANTQ